MWVAPPGQSVDRRLEICVTPEVALDRGCNLRLERGRRTPLERVARGHSHPRHMGCPNAQPRIVGLMFPSEGLAAIERFRDDLTRRRRNRRQPVPRSPAGRRHGQWAGFSHRKLSRVARTWPSWLIRESFHATGWTV